jgi:hypothetical protein
LVIVDVATAQIRQGNNFIGSITSFLFSFVVSGIYGDSLAVLSYTAAFQQPSKK